jgi:hypothetical protein
MLYDIDNDQEIEVLQGINKQGKLRFLIKTSKLNNINFLK